jgi:hypothetical protein
MMIAMKNIFKFLIVILFSFFTTSFVDAQNRKERKILYNSQYNYEIEALGVGQDGTKVFKIWGYGSTVGEAVLSAKANAVAACIFKGLTGGAGAAPTPPICTEANIEVTKSDYFEKFFELGGKYLQYVAVTNDGNPAGEDRLKIKKGYKVAIYVQVMYDALRRQLEADGIARRLDAGF